MDTITQFYLNNLDPEALRSSYIDNGFVLVNDVISSPLD